MLNFNEFRLQEADTQATAIQKLRTQISEKFDAIEDAKNLKKQGNVNSEVDSINKQAALYAEISNLMKTLAASIKTSGKTQNIY